MRIFVAIVGTLGLMPIAVFCLFGFAATFEPTNQRDVFTAFRIGYVLLGLGCLTVIVFLMARCFRKQPDPTPRRPPAGP
mgnify:FL=1